MEANENFLNNVFAEASSFGDIPVLVVGDFKDGLVHDLWGKVCRIGKEFLQCQPFTPFWTQTYVPAYDFADGSVSET